MFQIATGILTFHGNLKCSYVKDKSFLDNFSRLLVNSYCCPIRLTADMIDISFTCHLHLSNGEGHITSLFLKKHGGKSTGKLWCKCQWSERKFWKNMVLKLVLDIEDPALVFSTYMKCYHIEHFSFSSWVLGFCWALIFISPRLSMVWILRIVIQQYLETHRLEITAMLQQLLLYVFSLKWGLPMCPMGAEVLCQRNWAKVELNNYRCLGAD